MKLFAVALVLAACGGKSSSTSTTPKDTSKGAMGGASYAKAGSAAPAPMPANPCEGK